METSSSETQDARRQPTYGGFWRRVGAGIIDWLIVSIVAGVIINVGLAILNVSKDFIYFVGIVGLFAFAWIYFAVNESSRNQSTPGKRIFGMKVTDLNGERITFQCATTRFCGKSISLLALCVGFLMIAFTKKKQGLHDMVAGCLVITPQSRSLPDSSVSQVQGAAILGKMGKIDRKS